MKLADQMAQREVLAEIHNRVVELERTPPKILDGVPDTLAYLTSRHRLILFTKGEPAEQAAKVERSGLQGFFEAIEIVAEKDAKTYTAAGEQTQNREDAWLDDRQQSAERHQSGDGSGTERGVHPARKHVATGA